MAKCWNCGVETSLYILGRPVCVDCDNSGDTPAAGVLAAKTRKAFVGEQGMVPPPDANVKESLAR
jgi:hypothetical protein